MFELRPYQMRAVDHVLERQRAGVRRLLVVAPTGAGKATLAAELALQFAIAEKRVLFVAHRRELILQAYRRFADHGVPERELGVIMADDPRRRPRALVQIASIDTLRARTKPRADLVMVDEAHRALAKSYRDLETHYPHALHLGLTATPYRASGRGLGDAYDELFAVATPKELIADGYLVEPRAFTIPADRRPDLSRVRVRKGDYDERALADAMDRGALVGDIVEHWKKHASGVRTVAFAASVAHSKHIAERFRAAGVAAEHLDGTMTSAERDAITARIERGETLVVANMGVLCLDARTEILTRAGWVGIDAMTQEHAVANWDRGHVTFELPAAIFRRERLAGERMVQLVGRSIDVRVTEGHALVYRHGGGRSFQKRPARELVGKSVLVPACGQAAPDELVPLRGQAPLSWRRCVRHLIKTRWNLRNLEAMTPERAEDEAVRRVLRKAALRHKRPEELSIDECQFIGFWLGDGSRTLLGTGGVEYRVFQIAHAQTIVQWFERVLARLGLHAVRRALPIPAAPTGLPIRQRSPLLAWSLCRGSGGGSQERRGLYSIEPYLEKNGSDLLWGLDRLHFEALLHGLWMADGDHRRGGEWLPRSFKLHQKNRRLLDLLQAIAAVRGFRSHLKSGLRDGMRWLSLSKRAHHSVSAKTTFGFENVHDADERVWCVKTRSGAIITRRNGKVAVLGNCEGWDQPSVKCAILARPTKSTGLYLQQAGRILRPWDGQPATILDHAGCVLEHGLPQEDRPFSLGARPSAGDGAERDAASPVRVCSSCNAILAIAARACTSCQKSLFVEREREGVPEESAGQLIVATEDVVRRAEWGRLCATATERGYQPGWAFHEFRQRFGDAPPAEWPRPRPIQNVDVRSIARVAVRERKGHLSWDAFG